VTARRVALGIGITLALAGGLFFFLRRGTPSQGVGDRASGPSEISNEGMASTPQAEESPSRPPESPATPPSGHEPTPASEGFSREFLERDPCIFIDSFCGRVISEAGEPLPGASLTLKDNREIVGTTESDAKGEFCFGGCAPGQNLFLEAEKPGFAPVRSRPCPAIFHTVVMPAAKRWSGTVVSMRSGLPISNAGVSCFLSGERRRGLRYLPGTTTDTQGSFSFDLPRRSKRVRLDVSHRDYASKTASIELEESSDQLGTFILQEKSFLSIPFFVHGKDREPIAGVRISYGFCHARSDILLDNALRLYDENPGLLEGFLKDTCLSEGDDSAHGKTLRTDETGLCAVTRVPASARQSVLFLFSPAKVGFGKQLALLPLDGERWTPPIDPLPVPLPVGRGWRGRVLSCDGSFLAGCEVRVSTERGGRIVAGGNPGNERLIHSGMSEDLLTDAGGRFASQVVTTALLQISIRHRDLAATLQHYGFRPPSDPTEETTFSFPPGATVKFYPLAPLPGGPLDLEVDAIGHEEFSIRIGDSGAVLRCARPGRYLLHGLSRWGSVSREFVVLEGQMYVEVPFEIERFEYLACKLLVEGGPYEDKVGSTFSLRLVGEGRKRWIRYLGFRFPTCANASLSPSGEIVFYPVLAGTYRLTSSDGYAVKPHAGVEADAAREEGYEISTDGMVFRFEFAD